MKHATEEQLVNAYYGDTHNELRGHLDQCSECAAEFARLKEMLDAVSDYPVPQRSPAYGSIVWNQLKNRLPQAAPSPSRSNGRLRWWVLGPAFAAALTLAFFAGIFVSKKPGQPIEKVGIAAAHASDPDMDRARERILLLAIGDHLERSQIVLTDLMHANSQTIDLASQRKIAHDLVDENRLLRQRAAHTGDMADAALLDDIQRVLLDLANGSGDMRANQLATVQRSIEDQSLLFKIRIMSVDDRRKGQTL